MNKRGQFYLIAAVIIVGLIIGFGATYNSVKGEKKDDSASNLLNEMQYELSQVIDSSIYQKVSAEELSSRLNTTLEAYAYNYPDAEFVLIFGDESQIISKTAYNVYFSLVNGQRIIKSADLNISGDEAMVSLSNSEKYEFPIKQQNLYLIVKIVNGEEKSVKTNYL